METIKLRSTPVLKPLSRPVFFLGVPMSVLAVVLFLTLNFFLIMGGNPLMLVVGVPFWYVLKKLYAYDPDIFRVLFFWISLKLTGAGSNRRVWGGARLAPAKVWRRFDIKDFG